MKPICITFFVLLIFVRSNGQSISSPAKNGISSDGMITFVEQQPVFPGGDEAFLKFMKENVKYPEAEKKDSIQHKVLMRFVVDTDGSVTDVQVIRPVSPGLDKEAVRVVKLLPKFKPGYAGGQPVKAYLILPIVFRLN